MTVDSGREVGYDGTLGQGAIAYFDAVSDGRDPKVVVNWWAEFIILMCSPTHMNNRITHELLGQLAHRQETFSQNPLSAVQMGDLIDLVQSKRITGNSYSILPISDTDPIAGTSGKTILRHILEHRSARMPSELAADMSLLIASDGDVSLRTWCVQAIEALPGEAQRARDGNINVVNRLVGHVMKISRGRADAKSARDMLLDLLSS